jgi:bifunctional non-homologous end joining protein LigD
MTCGSLIGGYRPLGKSLEILLVGKMERGKLVFVGKVHGGLTPPLRLKLVKMLGPLQVAECQFVNLPTTRGRFGEGITRDEMNEFVWARPEIEVELKFAEWTDAGLLRHPDFGHTLAWHNANP